VEGPVYLMRHDSLTQGRTLFKQNCAVCHSYTNKDGKQEFDTPEGGFKASDLGGYGDRDPKVREKWIHDLVRNPGDERFFGRTKLNGMRAWAKKVLRERETMSKKDIDVEVAEFALAAEWLATSPTKNPPPVDDTKDQSDFAKGYRAFEKNCYSCHPYGDVSFEKSKTGPDMKGYMSQDWIRLMVMSPAHERRYRHSNNYMPAFRPTIGPGTDVHAWEFKAANRDPKIEILPLSNIERELIIRWMTGDYRVVFGGAPISGPKKAAEKD